jgi:hypothetical protein
LLLWQNQFWRQDHSRKAAQCHGSYGPLLAEFSLGEFLGEFLLPPESMSATVRTNHQCL